MTISARLIGALGTIGDAIPAEVRESAKLHLLDAIGVGLAAGASGAGRVYVGYAAGLRAGPRACCAVDPPTRPRPPSSTAA